IGISLFIVCHSLYLTFDHDEHQFIAGAFLVARDHLLPYRDFAFFHTPNILFIYAILFSFTNHFLLSARLFSAACAVLSIILIFVTALKLWTGPKDSTCLLVAASAVLLLVSQPLFLLTSGLAWNHDFPELLLLLAVLAQCRWMRTGNDWLLFLSGALLGIATGTRLTYVLPIIPFAGAILFMKRVVSRPKSLATFAAGLIVSLTPSALMFALAPSAFLFGNLGYARLNAIYGRDICHLWPATLPDKLEYVVSRLLLAQHAALLLLILFSLAVFLLCAWRKTSARLDLVFIAAVIVCCLPGSFGPTPTYPQYFYQQVPLLVLGIVFGIASLYAEATPRDRRLIGSMLGVAVVCTMRWRLLAASAGIVLMTCIHPHRPADHNWPITEDVRKLGMQPQASVGSSGKVLTLVPVYALEGGMDIYPEFATGSFAWRTASQLNDADRARYKMVSPADLDELLRSDPPAGIIVGAEPIQMEYPLVQYAKQHNYSPLPMSDRLTIWVLRQRPH
ncbi:MAG: hypothetical protein WAK26_02340, partial [Terracidiphilus sp.]